MNSMKLVPVNLQNFIDAAAGRGGSPQISAESSTGYTSSHAGAESRSGGLLPYVQSKNDNKNNHSIKKRAASEIGESRNGPDDDFRNELKKYIQEPMHGGLKAVFQNDDKNKEIVISEVVERFLRRLMLEIDHPRPKITRNDIGNTALRMSKFSDNIVQTPDGRRRLPPTFFYWEPIVSAVNKGDYRTALNILSREIWLSVRLVSDKLPDNSGQTTPAPSSRPVKKRTDLMRDEFDHQFSFKIVDDELPGTSGQNTPPSNSSADKSKKTTDSMIYEYDDDFADSIINKSKDPTQEEVESAKQDISSSVRASRIWLVDGYTSNMIDNTMHEVLTSSPTFRAILGYNNSQNLPRIRDAICRNAFRINKQGEKIPIWRNRKGSTDAGIYIGPAPDRQSAHFPTWQSSLIHEYIHYLTNAKDPFGEEAKTRQGPTEILTRRVAEEMGWPMPEFEGYGAPARREYLANFYRESMREVQNRHANNLAAFFQRFQTISAGNEASPDFSELRDAPGTSDVAHSQNNTNAFPGVVVDNPDITGQSSGVLAFPFVDSSPSGAPTGYQSALAATSASWETKSRFFKYGAQVEGNPHIRGYKFPDGSRVVVKAHELLPYSDIADKKTTVTTTITGGTGAAVGAGIGSAAGPFGTAAGTIVGGGIGALTGWAASSILAKSEDNDTIRQGFTLQYYENEKDTKPFDTQYMYASDTDQNRINNLGKDNKIWPDYAIRKPENSITWHRVSSVDAPVRDAGSRNLSGSTPAPKNSIRQELWCRTDVSPPVCFPPRFAPWGG